MRPHYLKLVLQVQSNHGPLFMGVRVLNAAGQQWDSQLPARPLQIAPWLGRSWVPGSALWGGVSSSLLGTRLSPDFTRPTDTSKDGADVLWKPSLPTETARVRMGQKICPFDLFRHHPKVGWRDEEPVKAWRGWSACSRSVCGWGWGSRVLCLRIGPKSLLSWGAAPFARKGGLFLGL